MQENHPNSARAHAGAWLRLIVSAVAILCAGPASAQHWGGYARDGQHDALSPGPSLVPSMIRWQTPVDLDPQYAGGGVLYIHYGSPAITGRNTVLVPQKTGATGGFGVNAFKGATGQQIWTINTDYVLPTHNWTPPMGVVLQPGDRAVVIPAAGGTVLVRNNPDLAGGSATRVAFFGIANFNQNPQAFSNAIQISTPITSDSLGNLYFGYVSSGAALPGYPNGIPSGLARIPSSGGTGAFVSAQTLCGDNTIQKVAYNCTPAVSADSSKVYVAVNAGNFTSGYLCLVAAETLKPQKAVMLEDPRTGAGAAVVTDDGTASPTIGPDGDVYYGVLEANLPSHNDRGWMLHFNSGLTTTKIPGSFGWDDSPSIVPSGLVPSYTGKSSYLILTKYNNYAVAGGNGMNKVAILDPNAAMKDPIDDTTPVMQEVITVLGPTQNQNAAGVDEWCINSAAVNAAGKCAVINSEDGHVYRWNFTSNTLSTGLKLAPPTGEAYTSTAIGPDGAVYAINNAVLFCCQAGGPAISPVLPGPIGPGGDPVIRPIDPGGAPVIVPRLLDFFIQGAGVIGVLAATFPPSGDQSLEAAAQLLIQFSVGVRHHCIQANRLLRFGHSVTVHADRRARLSQPRMKLGIAGVEPRRRARRFHDCAAILDGLDRFDL